MTVHHVDPDWWLSCDAELGCSATTPKAVTLDEARSSAGWTTRMQAIGAKVVGRWHLCNEHKRGKVK